MHRGLRSCVMSMFRVSSALLSWRWRMWQCPERLRILYNCVTQISAAQGLHHGIGKGFCLELCRAGLMQFSCCQGRSHSSCKRASVQCTVPPCRESIVTSVCASSSVSGFGSFPCRITRARGCLCVRNRGCRGVWPAVPRTPLLRRPVLSPPCPAASRSTVDAWSLSS